MVNQYKQVGSGISLLFAESLEMGAGLGWNDLGSKTDKGSVAWLGCLGWKMGCACIHVYFGAQCVGILWPELC